jgi:fucose permease
MWEVHTFLIALIKKKKKKKSASHMFKGHMSILYVGCMKFLTNWFVENFCPSKYTSQ